MKTESVPDLRKFFRINDNVRVVAIDIDGFVDKIETSFEGTMYRVVYWWDGKRHEEWMHSRELIFPMDK